MFSTSCVHFGCCHSSHICYLCFPAVVPPGSIDLLKKLPGVPNIEVTAKYPTVEGTMQCSIQCM